MLTIITAAILSATSGPLAFVKAADADVQKVLARSATTAKLAAVAETYIDFAELAKRALGQKEWAKLDKKKQQDFTSTMKGLLRASYAQKALGDGKKGATFEFGAEKVEGNEASVDATLVTDNQKFPVVYKLYRLDEKGGWRIYDVVTDDVSLVSTYADQFRRIIAQKGFDGLLTSLKAKRDQLENGAATAGSGSTP